MAADIAVLSHDLTALAPDDITQAAAMVTIMDGAVTYQRPG